MNKPPEPRVIIEPPSDDALREIARRICERLKCPESTYEFAAFLKVVARARARMLNALAELDKPRANE